MINNKQLVQVHPDFLRDALYDRYELVKDNRGGEIYDEFIDDLVELICDCWTNATAWEIIDNWLINAEHYTYSEIFDWYIYDEDDEELNKKREELDEDQKEIAVDYIHRRAEDHWHRYSDNLEETIAYYF